MPAAGHTRNSQMTALRGLRDGESVSSEDEDGTTNQDFILLEKSVIA